MAALCCVGSWVVRSSSTIVVVGCCGGRLCVVLKTASLVLDFVNDIAVAALIMPFVGWFLAVRSASIVITMVLV